MTDTTNNHDLIMQWHQDSMEWREVMLHVFIQWLAHNNILDQWTDEMCNENEDLRYTIENRSERLRTVSTTSFVKSAFGFRRSLLGPAFWIDYSGEWIRQVGEIDDIMMAGKDRMFDEGYADED